MCWCRPEVKTPWCGKADCVRPGYQPTSKLDTSNPPQGGFGLAKEPAPDRLTAFLYSLMRDCIVPGEIERLIQEVEKHPGPYAFSNRFLADYADEIAGRLLVGRMPVTG